MSKKIRVYLDTSVISYLDQQDSPDKMEETKNVWDILKNNKYDVIISNIALLEISECIDEKRTILKKYINELNYEEYKLDEETEELAKEVIQEGILKPKSKEDALHIAAAILADADIILSWNFKHLVNVKTINGVRKICFSKNFNKIIDIYSPNMLLERGEEDDE